MKRKTFLASILMAIAAPFLPSPVDPDDVYGPLRPGPSEGPLLDVLPYGDDYIFIEDFPRIPMKGGLLRYASSENAYVEVNNFCNN